MFRIQFLLVLIVLYLEIAHAWDIAVSVGDRLEFYTDGTKTDTVQFKSRNLTAIVYDEVHNMMLFVDKQKDNDAICGYGLSSTNIRCFVKRYGSDIHDLAIEPAKNLLFFTDIKERSINWISLKNRGSENNVGNRLINFYDRTPTYISVDSCRGYIYWINSKNNRFCKDYMERARLNGSEREVIYQMRPVHNFAIDPQTRKNYYTIGNYYEYFYKTDLSVKNINVEKKLIFFNRNPVHSQELTISKDNVYWINSASHTVWQILKNPRSSVKAKEVIRFYNGRPFGIAANYRIVDQVEGLLDCESLSSLIPTIKAMAQSAESDWLATVLDETSETTQSTETDIWTTEQATELDETAESTESTVTEMTWKTEQATELYETTESTDSTETDMWTTEQAIEPDESTETEQSGELDADLMFQKKNQWVPWFSFFRNNMTTGTGQTVEMEFEPKCRCKDSYFGQRHEVHACHGYCLNNGNCSLNEKREPVCQCKGDYVGDRCEVSGCLNYCFQGSCSLNDEGHPKCRCNAGYAGARCEVSRCHSYCLNNGDCSLNEEDKPVCQCVGNYEGSRCEAVKTHTVTYIPQYYSEKRNLTLADLLSNWRQPAVNISVVVQV